MQCYLLRGLLTTLVFPYKDDLLPPPRAASPLPPVAQRRYLAKGRKYQKVSAAQSTDPPFSTALIYNQSKHACQSVLADLRAVWGSKIRVFQTLEVHCYPSSHLYSHLWPANKSYHIRCHSSIYFTMGGPQPILVPTPMSICG